MKIKDARLNAGLTQQAMSDLLEIPLDDDGEVDYDEPSDIFDVYIKPYAN